MAAAWTNPLADAILSRCDLLGSFSETPENLTRTFLTAPMKQVHDALGGWMREAGMTVRLDAIGNLIGHYPARDPDAPVFLLGSHLDTVPAAGKYDGILGVLLAVAAVQALAQAYGDYYAAVADYNRAQFRLYRALGRPAEAVLPDGAACPTRP